MCVCTGGLPVCLHRFRRNFTIGWSCLFVDKTLLVSDTVYLAMLTVFLLNSRSEPSDVGMLSLAAFLQFWGVVFLATTVFVCFFKAEVGDGVNYKVAGLVDTYRQVKLDFAPCRSLLLSCWG